MQPGPCVQQLLDAGYDAPLPADQALMDTSNQTQTARAAVRPKRFKSSPSDRFALVTAHHEHSHQLTEKESKAKLSRQQIRNVRDRTLEDLHQLAPHLPTMMTNWKEFDSLKKPTDTMYTAAKKSENTSGSDRHKTSDMEVYQLMLPHKLRSAQAEKPAMLHMDSIARHAAMVQKKSAAAVNKGGCPDSTGCASAYGTHMLGRKFAAGGQEDLVEPLRGGMDEGDLLNDGNGLDEADLDAEDDILNSFVNERFESEDKENHVTAHRLVLSAQTPQSSGSHSSRPASSARRQAYQPRGMSRSTPWGGRGMRPGEPWNPTDQRAADGPTADRLAPTTAYGALLHHPALPGHSLQPPQRPHVPAFGGDNPADCSNHFNVRRRTRKRKVEELDSLKSDIHDALTSLKEDDRAADAMFLEAFTASSDRAAAISDRTLKVLEQLVGMLASTSNRNATNAG